MAVDKLVDSTQLGNALGYTASRIRTKTGSSSLIPFDLEHGLGFGDAVDAIPSGGGVDTTPYTVSVGTITLLSDGKITIPTPNIDGSQYVAVFFMIRDYEQVAAELFAAGRKLSFGVLWAAFGEYRSKSGLSDTAVGPKKVRYGVDNTALNYYSSVTVNIGNDALSFNNVYAAGTYDYVVVFKEAQS